MIRTIIHISPELIQTRMGNFSVLGYPRKHTIYPNKRSCSPTFESITYSNSSKTCSHRSSEE